MKTTNKVFTINELNEMMKKGELIRESMQRTPSHDTKKALEIVDSILSNRFAGIITLATIEKNNKKVYSILDGSSRLKDIQDYINGNIFFTITTTTEETTENGTKTIKSKINKTFNNMLEKEKEEFLNYKFNCIILEDATDEERQKAFININSSVALSNIQKTKGLVNDNLQQIFDIFTNSKIVNNIFTARQIQKDEIIMLSYTTLANIFDCYTASNKKLVQEVNKIDLSNFNLERLKQCLQLFDNIEIKINKYVVISHIANLYNSSINDLLQNGLFDNNVIFATNTAGANSTPENDKRLLASIKALNNFYNINIKTGKPTKKAEAIDINNNDDILAMLEE